MFVKGVGDDGDSPFARQLANGVRTHAVGHDKDVAALQPLVSIAGEQDGMGVLIVAAADTHVGQACVLEVVEAIHYRLPRIPRLP